MRIVSDLLDDVTVEFSLAIFATLRGFSAFSPELFLLLLFYLSVKCRFTASGGGKVIEG